MTMRLIAVAKEGARAFKSLSLLFIQVWLTVSAVGMTALGSQARAEPLGGRLEQFATNFNAAAKAAKSTVRVAKSSCSAVIRATCSFDVTNKITIIAVSMEDKDTLGNLSIHMDGTPRDVAVYFRLLDVLLRMYAPASSDDERRVTLGKFTSQIAAGDDARVKLDGLEVSAMLIPGVASITEVGRGDIGLDNKAEGSKLN